MKNILQEHYQIDPRIIEYVYKVKRRINDKIQEGIQIVLPVAHCIHHVNMITDPVFVGHKYFSVDENQTSVGKNIALHLMQKKTELWIGGGENRGEAQLTIVVRAAKDTVYLHRGQLVLKFNHFCFSFMVYRKI